jgi:hypothetical protein
MSVPAVVDWYLGSSGVSKLFRDVVILGGLVWICLAFFIEDYVYLMLGITRADAAIHWRAALEAVQKLDKGQWPFHRTVPLGNEAYVAYLTFLRMFLGATNYFAIALNGFLAFLGGLTLARALTRVFPLGRGREKWLALLIFCPSTVFWTTSNMKEGLMYWAVCQMLAPLIEAPTKGRAPFSFMSIMGVGVAGIFRPHIAMIWVFAAAFVGLLLRGKKSWAIILILFMPVVFLALRAFIGSSLMSPDEALAAMERQYRGLATCGAGSSINYGPGGPIFFVSGFLATFFRPLPWEINSFRTLIACAETWGLTILLILAWLQMTSYERRQLFRVPAVWVSILICLFFSVIFSYLPVEGLIVRQRVQMIPGLLVAALCPWLLREQIREQRRLAEAWCFLSASLLKGERDAESEREDRADRELVRPAPTRL